MLRTEQRNVRRRTSSPTPSSIRRYLRRRPEARPEEIVEKLDSRGGREAVMYVVATLMAFRTG